MTTSPVREAKACIQHLLDALVLEPLRHEQIGDIARLHYKELSWSVNGHLGQEHIQALYEAMMRSANAFGYVIYKNGILLGFVTATNNSSETREHLLHVYRNKLFPTLRLLIRHPSFLLGALESVLVMPWMLRRFGTRAEWLTIVTNTELSYLGPFVALRLIDAVRDHFRQLSVECYLGQSVKRNPKPMQLFAKLQLKVVARLLIHNIYLYEATAPDAARVLESRQESSYSKKDVI